MRASPHTQHFAAVTLVIVALTEILVATAYAQESGRIKRKRPTGQEADRLLSETVMNDGSLQKGDIVATDRGFFVFEGVAADGVTNIFRPISNPSGKGR
jgi:hypothetical protein